MYKTGRYSLSLEIYQFIIFHKHKRGLSSKEMMLSKRRRTATATADITLCVTDLPVGILVDAASYLKPSSALFAVSMSVPFQLLGKITTRCTVSLP